jgi:hypothetical protein
MIGTVRRAILIALAGLLVVPGAAGAAVRYAAPGGGSVLGCERATPCSLSYAIIAAGADDEVVVTPGTYPVAATIEAVVPLTIRGEVASVPLAGESRRPRIVGAPGVTPLESSERLTVADLTVESSETLSGTLYAVGDGSVFERLELVATGETSNALRPGNDFTLTDSLLRASGKEAGALFLQGTETGSPALRNDTLIGSGQESTGLAVFVTNPAATVAIAATNVIASAATDVSAGATPGGTGAIALDHSNFDTSSGQVSGSATQTAPPLFVDSAAGDFHQAAGSPTIDAGVADAANGPTDLDGNPRAYGGRYGAFSVCGGAAGPPVPDIGAYEEIYAIAVPAMICRPPLTRPNTRITAAKIRKPLGRATFRFKAVGRATGFQCRLIRGAKKTARLWFKKCSSPAIYRNLKPGRYRFFVRAINGPLADTTPAKRRFRIP